MAVVAAMEIKCAVVDKGLYAIFVSFKKREICLKRESQVLPKHVNDIWALVAQCVGNECPEPGQSMPKACSLDAQGLFIGCPRLVHWMNNSKIMTQRYKLREDVTRYKRKRLRVYTLHNQKKSSNSISLIAVTAFSNGQGASLCIFLMACWAAIR